ncbi:YmaF family protein [Sporomusa malonica]|uniref:YmaF family protein n=1 Tax=Sporomusa malonica TaxID=112901 RepID=A0A1W2DUQ5_9FIRM|nr:YmaF family protein [Sporomusa malonica]SMD01171.1 YmaF family protein [Sporomusa malonica]
MPMNEEERKPKHQHHPQADMLHVHTYLTEVNVADDHQHVILGVSGPAREKGNTHVHRIHGRTSFISEEGECGGHWHTQDVMTGPAIEMPDCSHVHYFEGITSKDDDHCHTFAGATGLGPSLFYMEDTVDECEEEDYDDCCDEVEEEEECEMPVKMPKYKYKYGKRPEEE